MDIRDYFLDFFEKKITAIPSSNLIIAFKFTEKLIVGNISQNSITDVGIFVCEAHLALCIRDSHYLNVSRPFASFPEKHTFYVNTSGCRSAVQEICVTIGGSGSLPPLRRYSSIVYSMNKYFFLYCENNNAFIGSISGLAGLTQV